MNIGFWDNQLCETGTTIALYDYAFYNQTLLGNKSFIFYDKNNRNNKNEIIEKFKKYFIVHESDDFKDVDNYILKYNITHLYIIKAGKIDNRITKVAKNCIHCVFDCNKPHGDIFALISKYMKGDTSKFPVVPHMINLPLTTNNMRKELNIPDNAVVFGGYGGKNSFNIRFVQKIIYSVAYKNPNIYFLFANFNKFCPDLPNIIYLPMIIDLNKKVEFINTIDAMIWGRNIGETFGIAIGEFSSMNKPVIAMKIGDLNHYYTLGDKGIWYNNKDDLYEILTTFDPNKERDKDWNAYKDYTPEKVMEIFKKVFLD